MIGAVPEVLVRARDVVTPALRAWVDRLHPGVRRVVEYHFGWIDADGRAAAASGGKALRPALALLSAEAVGACVDTALPGAIAVELIHNFSLLHDDVMDGDTQRRHRPTAWSLFGVGPAIVAGDALLALAHEVLLELPASTYHRAALVVAEATQTMIAGQAEDLAFESRWEVTFGECLFMSARKTGALLACSASIGAILAEAPHYVVTALRRYGHHLGIAFQAVDDTFGVWGTAEITGKPAHSDLRQHKRTLPIVAALQASNGKTHRLRSLLDHTMGEGELEAAARLVDEAGGRARSLATAECHLEMALGALDSVELAPGPRGELRELAAFVTARDH